MRNFRDLTGFVDEAYGINRLGFDSPTGEKELYLLAFKGDAEVQALIAEVLNGHTDATCFMTRGVLARVLSLTDPILDQLFGLPLGASIDVACSSVRITRNSTNTYGVCRIVYL